MPTNNCGDGGGGVFYAVDLGNPIPTEINIPDGAWKLEINQASDTEVQIACCLERIADALERIAPYFEERTIKK